MEQAIVDTQNRSNACWEMVERDPRFQGILEKIPIRDPLPSLTILANSDLPTSQEIEDLYAGHQAIQPCRKIALEGMGRVHPALVSVFAEAYAGFDDDLLRLVNRQLTWGEYAQAYIQRRKMLTEKLLRTAQEIDAQLANAHAYELQQRQRAGQALMLWSAYQQQLYQQQMQLFQQQMMINAANRPHMTNCTYMGYQPSCTTY
jgi:LAS superfamily LD-carboxypeptidase LdcB